ncbi:MAG: hypothetical protein QF830_12230 [Rhodospirillales bacterium]|nr:hypothetical protein [Rhodospirillales bacterium]MDP6884897.1 hypothetical protein [Rhodospirillales bacterium]
MREKKAYWIGGTLTAFLGVALIKLLAPALEGIAGSVAVAAGYALAALGLTIIACATRRNGSDAFVTVEEDSADRERR